MESYVARKRILNQQLVRQRGRSRRGAAAAATTTLTFHPLSAQRERLVHVEIPFRDSTLALRPFSLEGSGCNPTTRDAKVGDVLSDERRRRPAEEKRLENVAAGELCSLLHSE